MFLKWLKLRENLFYRRGSKKGFGRTFFDPKEKDNQRTEMLKQRSEIRKLVLYVKNEDWLDAYRIYEDKTERFPNGNIEIKHLGEMLIKAFETNDFTELKLFRYR